MNHHDHDQQEPDAPEQRDAAATTGQPSAAAGAAGAEDAGPTDQVDQGHSATPDATGTEATGEVDTGGTEVDDSLDIEALADSDPRTKGELLAELLAAEAKRDEYLDDLRRSHADFENYRRRVMRDGALQRSAGKGEVAGALLEVLDDLDRTVTAAEGSPDGDLATGIRLVATKLLDALRQQGLERVDTVDVTFDPNVHEAVQQLPGEGIDGEPRVVTVLRPGYRMDDRVLRAAMVAVEN